MQQHQIDTIQSYDRYTDTFEQRFREHFERYVRPMAERFIQELPGQRILDLGCGAGDHALFFQERGLEVLCGDLSEAMLARCREKGLKAERMDLEALTIPSDPYHGIWLYASLLHVPKANAPHVVKRIADMLVPGGILGVALKGGDFGERYEEGEKYKGTKRFFAYYTDEEARGLFSSSFDLLDASQTDVQNGKALFLNYLLRKKTV